MAKEIKDLQKLIEEKAKRRLEQDLRNLARYILESPLIPHREVDDIIKLHIIIDNGTPSGRMEETHIRKLFYLSSYREGLEGDLLIALRNYWLPKYVEKEARDLLERVDKITTEVEDLLNFKNQQEDD